MEQLTITKQQLVGAFERRRSAAKLGVLEPLLDANDDAWWIWQQLLDIVSDEKRAAESAATGGVEHVRPT